MRRVAIYFFYDSQGIADLYIDVFLADFTQNVDRLIVVSNGELTDESRALFEKHTSEIIIRSNEGFDVWAYRAGLDHVGWDELATYDEVVLLNFTIMGPVYPFADTFAEMESRDVDFWGITKFGKIDYDPFERNPYGYLPEHIQSHFTVYRKRFLESKQLRAYWENIPPIESYEDAIGLHESYFTQHFADMGYTWAVSVEPAPEDRVNRNMIIFAPRLLIEKYHCPIFKRRSFFQPKDSLLNESGGEASRELLAYLKETDYDTDLIWENLIRTCHACDVVDTLGLVYVLSDRARIDPAPPPLRLALIMHLYYMDLLPESVRYASHMPEDADIFITTSRLDDIDEIRSAFSVLPNSVVLLPVENRGRDVSALLVGWKDYAGDYDLACFYHDKKTLQNDPPTVGQSFAYKMSMNSLATRAFVSNVITTFCENPRLGLLSPTEPNHAAHYPTLGNEWWSNFQKTKRVCENLNLNAPIARGKYPVAPLGTVFWFRPAALAKLFEHGYSYSSFPSETVKVPTDGGLMHAIERAYPFVTQDAGYYPAYVLSSGYAELEISNLRQYVRNFNDVCIPRLILGDGEIRGTNYGVVCELKQRLDDYEEYIRIGDASLRRHAVKYIKRKLGAVLRRLGLRRGPSR